MTPAFHKRNTVVVRAAAATLLAMLLSASLPSPASCRIADPTTTDKGAAASSSSSSSFSRALLQVTETEERYERLEGDLKCPEGSSNGRMFKNTDGTSSVEECYDRCYGLESCNFFSYVEASGTCIGCTLEDESFLESSSSDGGGVDSYRMVTMKTPSDFGYELWNGVEGIGVKCPLQHEDRIVKIHDTTKDECYHLCVDDEECRWFSWGEDEVAKEEWKGNCMLCREDDEVQVHEGFNFWRLLTDDDDDVTPPPEETPGPSASPTTTTRTSCPGDVTLVAHTGVTLCESVSVVSQDETTVTVALTQDCTPSGSSVDHMFWQYHQSVFSDKCLGEDDVQGGYTTPTFTIVCAVSKPNALLNVWVADEGSKGVLSSSEDDATVPRCCHPDVSETAAVYNAVYSISCVPTC